MELKKLSASSLTSAENCLARFHAETVAGYGATMRNNYARLGSSVHGALEDIVKTCFIEEKALISLELLTAFYKKHFMAEFETAELAGSWYEDGLDMLKNWYADTDFSYFKVLSCEVKEYFSVNTSIGPIPVTYIIDRLDEIEPGIIRVVDYKTSNELLTKDLLRAKIQARIYALAMQIKYKDQDIKEIWVEFNMLRFSPVNVLFTREDNAATYRMLQRAAERIIAARVDEDNPVEKLETLNPACKFCIRKTTCSAVMSNIKAGGALGYTSLEEMINARAMLEFQKKAAESAAEELETLILKELEEMDLIEAETDLIEAKVGMSKRRQLDVDKIIEIIGEEEFRNFGGRNSITVTEFDRLCKQVPREVATRLKEEALDFKFGEPKLQVKMKGSFTK